MFRRGRQAVIRPHRRHAVLDRLQPARHPRRHELPKQAELRLRIRTVVSGNPEPERGLAPLRAVAGKPAATARMDPTARKHCILPSLRATVSLGGKAGLVVELHRAVLGPESTFRASPSVSSD